MAAKAIEWPVALLPRMVDFQPELQSRSGGLSMLGSEQITVSPSGRWRAKVTMAVRGENANLSLRAFVANMEGRAGTVLVPKWERYRPRNFNGVEFSQVASASYGDDGFNFDLSGFGQGEFKHASLAAEAAAGTTRIQINMLDGEGPRPGHYFGLDDRLYRCQQVWQDVEGSPTQVQFWPRMRSTWDEGERVILDHPVCLMRFAEDSTGEEALSRAGSGMVTFEFVEAI